MAISAEQDGRVIGGPDRRARTLVEMYFAASLRGCAKCGARPNALAVSADGDRRTLRGTCRFCGTPASFDFFVEGDPEKNTPPPRELGGAEPSKVVTASELASELGRLKNLGIDASTRGRALTCILELLKHPEIDAGGLASLIEDRDRFLSEDAPPRVAAPGTGFKPRLYAEQTLMPRFLRERGASACLDAIEAKDDAFFSAAWRDVSISIVSPVLIHAVHGQHRVGIVTFPEPHWESESYAGVVVSRVDHPTALRYFLWSLSVTGEKATVIGEWDGASYHNHGAGPPRSGDLQTDAVELTRRILALSASPQDHGLTLEGSLSRPNARCAWAHAAPRAPFQVSDAESPAIYRWSADGKKLWTRPNLGGAEWSQWDRHTGDRLRRAPVPDDLARPILPYDVATALVGRKPDGRPVHTILALSPDFRRAVLADSHGDGEGKLRDVAGGTTLCTLTGMTKPFAFSPDGEKLVGRALGKRALIIVSARDGAPIAEIPFTEDLPPLTEASWAPGGELLFNIQVPGHDDDRLLCFSVEHRKTLWKESGYFTSMEISRLSNSVAAFTRDGGVRIWNIPSGVQLRSIAKEEMCRPLLCGEPDVQSQWELLRHNPIRFSIVPAITSLRPFAGGKKIASSMGLLADTGEPLPAEPLPWRPMDEGEVRAAMGKLLIPAASWNAGPVASDGSFAVFFLHRDEREIPDPDAGTIYESDPSVALWDRQESAWRWETSDAPGPFMLRWLCGHGELELSWDESGLFALGSGHPRSSMLYDVATGTLRAAHAGDVPEGPPGATSTSVLATDRSRRWSLLAHDSAIEVWDLHANQRVEAIELASIYDKPTVAAFLDGAAFVVGTTNGRVLRFDVLGKLGEPLDGSP